VVAFDLASFASPAGPAVSARNVVRDPDEDRLAALRQVCHDEREGLLDGVYLVEAADASLAVVCEETLPVPA
jgi:hypothetical protein